ncbi:hypothetical protein BC833DRAFT_586688 [Globomyces pollinis-pini]|nr:hypothetical protein BC833DRAFT_586688 [Globomyces pollinis-pini]
MFSSAVIATTAGLLTISGVDSKSLNISGNEGDISLSRVNAVDLNCSTITGVIELENVQSVNTKLLSKTGTLRMINLNTIKLKILSSEDSAIMIKDGAYHELNAVSVHGSIHLSVKNIFIKFPECRCQKSGITVRAW